MPTQSRSVAIHLLDVELIVRVHWVMSSPLGSDKSIESIGIGYWRIIQVLSFIDACMQNSATTLISLHAPIWQQASYNTSPQLHVSPAPANKFCNHIRQLCMLLLAPQCIPNSMLQFHRKKSLRGVLYSEVKNALALWVGAWMKALGLVHEICLFCVLY